MAIFKAHTRPGILKASILYADKDRRAEHNDHLTIGINCSKYCNIAYNEMMKVKELYGKLDGRQCQHYILSFAKDEITLSDAVKYVEKHAEKCFGDRFQVFVGVHINSESKCIHAHYIVNSVSFIDGYKIQTSKEDYNRYRDYNDEIAREYGLTIIDRSPEAVVKRGRPQLYSMNEYQLQKKVATIKKASMNSYITNCYNAVTKCLDENNSSLTKFTISLNKQGWYLNLRGKNIVFVNCIDRTQKIRANTLARKYNNPNISTPAILLRCHNKDWSKYILPLTSKNHTIQNSITPKKPQSIISSFDKIRNHKNTSNEYQHRKNKMKIKLHNNEYENDDYGI